MSRPETLENTVPYMLSDDWFTRLQGEAYQLDIRVKSLQLYLKNHRDPLLEEQLAYMKAYLDVLLRRIANEQLSRSSSKTE